jgi:cytochrome d ubiquinol oxidase subunit II
VTLEHFWFVIIAVLWAGYFLLEGFDFGVGMLLPFLGRDEADRDTMFQSIGPVWDGNEVWLVVAAGATFAAFPSWYATLFSGTYLVLLAILVLLIVRVLSFEWRERRAEARWHTAWMWANTIPSFGVPFLWGLLLANLVAGVPLDSSHVFTGGIADLISPYTLVAGLAVVAVFATHGATYLAIRTSGDLSRRATAAAGRLGVPAAVLGIAIVAWTVIVAHQNNQRAVLPTAVPAVVTGLALLLAPVLRARGRFGWAFLMTGLAGIGFVATVFTGLFPRVLVSDPNFTNSLTTSNAASGHYALEVITVVALIFTPLLLVYQGWTYYVFRRRLGLDAGAPSYGAVETAGLDPDSRLSP